MPHISLVLHDIRSTYNVGAILRSCDAFGVSEVVVTGYTPYPALPGDSRPPHIADANDRAIAKTALGAEKQVRIRAEPDIFAVLTAFRADGVLVAALEQSPRSLLLERFAPPERFALILGNETEGIPDEVLAICDVVLEIPMVGAKESLNVAVSGSIALYALVRYPI